MGNAEIGTVKLCPVEDTPLGEDGFDARFEVDDLNILGKGKFSVVHPCWRRGDPEKKYALKVIETTGVDDHAALTRMYEEVNVLRVLGQHPSIIQLVDLDESSPTQMRLVLELCEGGELYDRIQKKMFYAEHEAKVLSRNLLQAVAFIHSKGIMHRDLKPENILLSSKISNTDIKISDLGLARVSKDYPNRLPRSRSICGSDFYLAPEVIKQEEYGREIDIWASGVVIFVVLSGSLPFYHKVLHKLYRLIVERDLGFPEPMWRNVSKAAQDFILRVLQVNPESRLTAEQGLMHPWLRQGSEKSSFGNVGVTTDRNGRSAHPLAQTNPVATAVTDISGVAVPPYQQHQLYNNARMAR